MVKREQTGQMLLKGGQNFISSPLWCLQGYKTIDVLHNPSLIIQKEV